MLTNHHDHHHDDPAPIPLRTHQVGVEVSLEHAGQVELAHAHKVQVARRDHLRAVTHPDRVSHKVLEKH
jgi:hypothetical protein